MPCLPSHQVLVGILVPNGLIAVEAETVLQRIVKKGTSTNLPSHGYDDEKSSVLVILAREAYQDPEILIKLLLPL